MSRMAAPLVRSSRRIVRTFSVAPTSRPAGGLGGDGDLRMLGDLAGKDDLLQVAAAEQARLRIRSGRGDVELA